MRDTDELTILATIPSGFCFGLQHITVDFFSYFPGNVHSHFLLTRWTRGEMEKLLKEKNIPYSFSWLGMFSRKMDWVNLKMSLHALIKLPKLYVDFIRLQKKLKPDILYFANHHELILLYPVLLFSKRKIVCHMHDPSPAIPFQQWTFKWYTRKVTRLIAISDNVRKRTIALGCPPAKIDTIHNGIIIPPAGKNPRLQELCSKAGWPRDVFIIGITGQMTATKGSMDLLEAFKLLHERNPKARLVIGGKPQEPQLGDLRQKISEWGLDGLVYFPGWLPEVSVFFQNIDLFVLASRHEEGYGLVVAEAMAHYLPVVITASGGAVEIVENEISGYIVPKRDPRAMSEKLYQLSVNSEIYKRMSGAARKRVEVEFNIEQQTKILVDYLFKLKQS
jgi:glycosyltransferase involved in cell wall biosynthesis